MYREIDSNINGYITSKPAPKEQVGFAKNWRYYRSRTGLAPWIGPKDGWQGNSEFQNRIADEGESQMPDDAQILKSSRTLRQWADDYCASNKILKEFCYEKVCFSLKISTTFNILRFLTDGRSANWRRLSKLLSLRPTTMERSTLHGK